MTSRLAWLPLALLHALAHAQPPLPPPAPAPAPPPTSPPVVVVNPAPAPAPRVQVVEPTYETVYDTYNAPVFTTGALLFLGGYGASVVVAASADQDELDRGLDRLYVPVVGPWLALNDRGSCPIEDAACDGETTAKVLLVADGVFQAAGVVTMVSGLLQPSSRRVPVVTARTDAKVRVTPTTLSGRGGGLSVFGRF